MPKIEDRIRPGEQGMPFLPEPKPGIPTSRLPPELQSLYEYLAGPSDPAPWPPTAGGHMPIPQQPPDDTPLGEQLKRDLDFGLGLAINPFNTKTKLEMLRTIGEKALPPGEYYLKQEEEKHKKAAKEPWADFEATQHSLGKNLKDH